MKLEHNWKEYKWSGDKWGEREIDYLVPFVSLTSRVCFRRKDELTWCVETHHTPEQLVKLGYLEEVKENKELTDKCDIQDKTPHATDTNVAHSIPQKIKEEVERRDGRKIQTTYFN